MQLFYSIFPENIFRVYIPGLFALLF